MKLRGRVKKLMDVRSGVSRVGNAWKAQDFMSGGEKIEELSLHEGDEIEVDLRCTVRSYGERLYNEPYARNVVVVKSQWQKVEEAPQPAPEQPAQQPTAEQKDAMERLKKMGEEAASGEEGGSESDLPF